MAGQLGFSWNADGDTVVHADLDGDTIADFAIVLAGWLTLDADDFIGVMA